MSDVLAEAFVRLRALNDGTFEKDARDQVVPSATRIAGDVARVFAGVKLFGLAKDGIAELGDAEKAAAQTAAVIQSTGGAANVTAGHVDELADSLLKLSGKDDEAIKQGENLLLTFKNIRNEAGAGNDIFDQTTKAALDLSVAFGQDMSASALQLGKALDDPVRGLTALQRIGVRFSQDQVDLIKNLVASGNTLEAQKVILKEVESQVGGSAKAYGETLPGQLERAQESMKNTKAALTGSLAPALELGANLAARMAEGVQQLPEPLQETLGAVVLVGGGIASLARPVSDVLNLISKWKTAHAEAAVATEALAAAHGSALATAVPLAAAVIGLGVALKYGTDHAEEFSLSLKGVSDVDLDKNLDKISAAAELTGKSMYDVAKSLPIDEAIRLADSLDRQGKSSAEVRRAVGDMADAQRDSNKAQAEAQNEIDGTTASTDKLVTATFDYIAAMKAEDDEHNKALDGVAGMQAAQIALTNAQIDGRAKIDALTKANKDGKLSADEHTKALDDAKSSLLSEASAAGDAAEKAARLAGATDTAATRQSAMVTELTNVMNTLAPGSPLRQFLQDYILQLLSVPTSRQTTFTVVTNTVAGGGGVNIGGGKIAAARGFQGMVRGGSNQEFVTGEDEDEYVSITPKHLMDAHTTDLPSASGTPVADPGGSSEPIQNNNFTFNFPNFVGSKNELAALITGAMKNPDVVATLSNEVRKRDRSRR